MLWTTLLHSLFFYSYHNSLVLWSLVSFSLTSGHLTCNDLEGEMNPKLWVALSGGKVVVFDAASWSMLQDCIQVGESQLVRSIFS